MHFLANNWNLMKIVRTLKAAWATNLHVSANFVTYIIYKVHNINDYFGSQYELGTVPNFSNIEAAAVVVRNVD